MTEAEIISLARVRAQKRALSQRRGKTGAFARRSSPDQLLEILRDVANHAADALSDGCTSAVNVRQTIWNQARRSCEEQWGPIPQANEVVRQLNDYLRHESGDPQRPPLSWRMWLMIAFDETKDHRKVLAGLAKAPERELSTVAIAYAIRTVAGLLAKEKLSGNEYEQKVEELRRRDEVAGRSSDHVRRAFPSRDQIAEVCGSWEAGCELAGLEAGQRHSHRPPALPLPEAVAYFYAQKGFLPPYKTLDGFARERDFSIASRQGKPWAQWIERGIERIQELELPAPPPYGERAAQEAWMPIHIEFDIDLPPRRKRDYTGLEILEAADEFRRWLEGRPHASALPPVLRWAAGHPRTQRDDRPRRSRQAHGSDRYSRMEGTRGERRQRVSDEPTYQAHRVLLQSDKTEAPASYAAAFQCWAM
jgi:hypothetical protein